MQIDLKLQDAETAGEKVVKIRIENVKTRNIKNESFNGNGTRREGTGASNMSERKSNFKGHSGHSLIGSISYRTALGI